MRALFDTSVLVAAFLGTHEDHPRAFPWLQRARSGEIELFISAHTQAELYSSLSGMPVRPRLPPSVAQEAIEEIVAVSSQVVELAAADYREVVAEMVRLGLSGGTVYDALIAHAARKVKVERLLTFNEKHFRRVWPDAGEIILRP